MRGGKPETHGGCPGISFRGGKAGAVLFIFTIAFGFFIGSLIEK